MKKSGWIILLLVVAALVVLLIIGGGSEPADTTTVDRDASTDTAATTSDTPEEGEASGDAVLVGGEAMVANRTIVENAQNASNLTTLVSAIEAAGLAETLNGDGPFTVFAPTNEAFNELPDGTLDTLLRQENQQELSALLTYHVVPANLSADELTGTSSVTTVNGESLSVSTTEDGSVMVGGEAMVETANATASNGVVHVIDTVLQPSN